MRRKYNLWVISHDGDELIGESLFVHQCLNMIKQHPKFNNIASNQIDKLSPAIYSLKYVKTIFITTDDRFLEGFKIETRREEN